MAYNYSKLCEVETNRHGVGGSLNIRIQPRSTAQIVAHALNCDPIYVDPSSENDGWIACRYNGSMGFAMAKFIKGTNAYGSFYSYSLTGTVDTMKHASGGSLNMRSDDSTTSSVVATIPNGTIIHVQTYSGTWLPAEYNNETGFVMAKFIRESDAYGNTNVSHPQNKEQAFGGSLLGRSSNYVNSGNAVYNVQLCLQDFVYPNLVLDGQFGDRTHEAVRQYQMYMQMDVDGIVGAQTKECLWNDFDDTLKAHGLIAN